MASRVLSVKTKYMEFESHVGEIFDFAGMELSGKRVLIKPNILYYTEDEQARNTNPTMVEAVAKECERRGAARVQIGDNAGQMLYGNSRDAFDVSPGFADRMARYYVNLGIDLVPVRLKSAERTVYLSKALFEADVVINMPKFKTHGLTGVSAALKNTFGYVPGGQKARLHVILGDYDPFDRLLAEIHSIRRPDLNIVDSVLCMQGRGPFSRYLYYAGHVVVSTDPVALDSALCRMIGLDPHTIGHIRYANQMGLGDIDGCEMVGELPFIDRYLLPPGFDGERKLNPVFCSQSINIDGHRTNFTLDRAKCVRCGKCIEQCPVGAIEPAEGYPRPTGRECVSCHACQEVCGAKAITIESTYKV